MLNELCVQCDFRWQNKEIKIDNETSVLLISITVETYNCILKCISGEVDIIAHEVLKVHFIVSMACNKTKS